MEEKDPQALSSSSTLDTSCLHHVLGHQLAMATAPTRKVFIKHIGQPLDLRPAEFSMLLIIANNAGVTQKQLAQALALPAPKVTVMLDRLSKKGLLLRERNTTDKRSIRVHLTPAGQELADRGYQISLRMENDLLRGLTQAERFMLLELLNKVARRSR